MRCSSTHFLLLTLLYGCLPQHETILSTSLPTSLSDIALHGKSRGNAMTHQRRVPWPHPSHTLRSNSSPMSHVVYQPS
ncbi:hypothetical protein EV421DRAFT_1839191 [Armillaria borealis]|uniref:Secreted protein n=1 Tax=Armillaria borealis TaxID=47425 RepID=A0AA39J3E7_9AGAR|nr:hypothetical protein EV421DRAFT_1839191 [Armillaria borealis]